MKLSIILMLLLLVGACAKSVSPDNYNSRLTSSQLDDNRFLVSYRGTTFEGDQRAVDMTLLRSAELVLEQGYHYFVIIETSESVKTDTHTTPENTIGQVDNDLDDYGFPPTIDGDNTYYHAAPGLTNTIVGFSQRPQGFAYVALILKAALRSKYRLDQLNQ